MKIKWGALVVDGRGKLGGHVASKNLGGSFLRTKVTPGNPQTSFQTAVRALFSSISQLWSSLNAAQISAWNAAVSEWTTTNIFGDIKKPSGKALFQRINQNLGLIGVAPVTTPPVKVVMPKTIVNNIVLEVGAEDLDISLDATSANVRLLIGSTGVIPASKTAVKNKVRNFTNVLSSTLSSSALYSAYVAEFGAPVAGNEILFRVRAIHNVTGQSLPDQFMRITAEA